MDAGVGRRKSGAELLSLGAGLAEGAGGNGKVLGVDVLALGVPWGGGAGVAESDGRGGGGVISGGGCCRGSDCWWWIIGVMFGGIGAVTESGPLVVLFGGLIGRGAGGVDEGGADGSVVSEVPLGAVDAGKTVLSVWCVWSWRGDGGLTIGVGKTAWCVGGKTLVPRVVVVLT